MTKQQPGIYITVDRDGWTKGIQISIEAVDDTGDVGVGYRIAGPKYNGSSTTLIRHQLSTSDIAEIKTYLAAAKPVEAA